MWYFFKDRWYIFMIIMRIKCAHHLRSNFLFGDIKLRSRLIALSQILCLSKIACDGSYTTGLQYFLKDTCKWHFLKDMWYIFMIIRRIKMCPLPIKFFIQ